MQTGSHFPQLELSPSAKSLTVESAKNKQKVFDVS